MLVWPLYSLLIFVMPLHRSDTHHTYAHFPPATPSGRHSIKGSILDGLSSKGRNQLCNDCLNRGWNHLLPQCIVDVIGLYRREFLSLVFCSRWKHTVFISGVLQRHCVMYLLKELRTRWCLCKFRNKHEIFVITLLIWEVTKPGWKLLTAITISMYTNDLTLIVFGGSGRRFQRKT